MGPEPPLFFLLFLLVAVVAGVFAYLQQQRRRQAMALQARAMGLEFAAKDPFHLDHLPFALFRKGDGREVENVMWGSYRGSELRVFDFAYYEQSTDSKGNTSRRWRRFSCAIAAIAADCPPVTIAPEGPLLRIAHHLGFPDIDFESEEFNRAFEVRSEDRRCAYALIDARMIEWLLSTAGRYRFEVVGSLVLGACERMEAEELPKLVWWLHGFREHVPDVLGSLYPAPA